jgi:predicted phosphodiesterase
MRNSFWVSNNFENVKKLKNIIKSNKGITRREIAKIMKKSTNSIEKAIIHYDIYLPEASATHTIFLEDYSDNLGLSKSVAKPEVYNPINWKIKKSKRKKAKRSFKKILVMSDCHIRKQNTPAVKCVLGLMDDVVFDGVYNLGDYLDYGCLSHFNKKKRLTMEGERLKNDITEGNRLLDEIDKRLPKGADKRFWYGNHEDWVKQYLEEHTELEGMLSPKMTLKLEERGYTVYNKVNHIEKIGRLYFTHGSKSNKGFLRSMITTNMRNVIFGHNHTQRSLLIPTAAREIAMSGYAVACLCDLDPDYAKNRPSAHSHGFAVVNFYGDNGFFSVELYRIINGIFIYGDKIYDGNK